MIKYPREPPKCKGGAAIQIAANRITITGLEMGL
jgi:hypothetical protein